MIYTVDVSFLISGCAYAHAHAHTHTHTHTQNVSIQCYSIFWVIENNKKIDKKL